jgi:hypothetical protein
MTKSGLTRHFKSCPARQAEIKSAQEKGGKAQTLYHLVVQDTYTGDFWLHLEMNGNAPFNSLDNYLRAIWLECCDHLSQFSIGGWRGEEIEMDTKAKSILEIGLELTHIYDFGTSSITFIKVVDSRLGHPLTKHPLKLMARNNMPEEICMECDQQATHFCLECVNDLGQSGLLCDEHVKIHPHDNYGPPTPLVNSPRVGMCGYDGPAEPPY